VNLAQFIDPAWVQERFPERVDRRPRAAQQAPMSAPSVVSRYDSDAEGVSDRIRKVLHRARVRLTLVELREQLADVPAKVIAGTVAMLVQRKDVDWNGARRNYRYGLTERGRSRVRG
jgi:hypothetical protein